MWITPILGAVLIQTPAIYSPGDIANDYVDLFVHSNKCSREYKKDCKIKIFYEALTVEMKILLGDSPSQRVDWIYMSYIHDLRYVLRLYA